MSLIVDGTTGVTFNDSSLQGAAASPYVLKNRIINGAMVIDQRNAGASVTPTSDGSYNLDRWKVGLTQASKFSVQQSSTAPTGFSYSALITSLSAYSVGSGDTFLFQQNIEGFNTADLNWGTANAQTVTLSFWVRSSLTGTFGGSIINSAANRAYLFSYTISSANTWEQKSVTITGDTTGTWVGATNGIGIGIRFGLGSGSTFSGTTGVWQNGNIVQPTGTVSVVGTNGATFYITGVQLEIGTSATPFERRLYNQELANCQRYYQLFNQIPSGATRVAGASPAAQGYLTATLPTQMRSAPTISLATSGTNVASGFSYAFSNGASDHTLSAGNNLEIQSQTSTIDILSFIMKSTAISWGTDKPLLMTSGKVYASAEL